MTVGNCVLGEGQGVVVSEEKVEPESTKREEGNRISVRSKHQKFVGELQKLNTKFLQY